VLAGLRRIQHAESPGAATGKPGGEQRHFSQAYIRFGSSRGETDVLHSLYLYPG
jgi:hypothetical protein